MITTFQGLLSRVASKAAPKAATRMQATCDCGRKIPSEHSLFNEIKRICQDEAITYRVDSSEHAFGLYLRKGCYCQDIHVQLKDHSTDTIYARNKEIICKLHNFVFNYEQELRSA